MERNPKDALKGAGKKIKAAADAALSSDAAKAAASHAKAAGHKISEAAKTAANSEVAKKVVTASKTVGEALKTTAESAVQSEAAQKVIAGTKTAGKAVAESAVGQATVQLVHAAAESAAGQKVQEVAASVQQAAQRNKKLTILLSCVLVAMIIIFIAMANAENSGAGAGMVNTNQLTENMEWEGMQFRVSPDWTMGVNTDGLLSFNTPDRFQILIQRQEELYSGLEFGVRNGSMVAAPVQVSGSMMTLVSDRNADADELTRFPIYVVKNENIVYVIKGPGTYIYSLAATMKM